MLPARSATARMLTARIRWRSFQPPVQRILSLGSSLLSKAVSYAVERLDCLEIGIGLPELAPKPLDVAVDRSVVDIDVVLVGDVHQLVARLDHPRPLRERLEDQEFGDGQN